MTPVILSSKPEFYGKMESLLNIPAGSVQGSQALSTLKSWDSLTILEFIVMADSEYQVNLEPSAIATCETVDDLAELTLAACHDS